MMEREELGRRWREAQFHAMAKAAEQQPEQPAEPDPEPSVMQTIAQRAGLKKAGLDPYVSPDDRLRRYAGLK
jgi:hypothetical protein